MGNRTFVRLDCNRYCRLGRLFRFASTYGTSQSNGRLRVSLDESWNIFRYLFGYWLSKNEKLRKRFSI